MEDGTDVCACPWFPLKEAVKCMHARSRIFKPSLFIQVLKEFYKMCHLNKVTIFNIEKITIIYTKMFYLLQFNTLKATSTSVCTGQLTQFLKGSGIQFFQIFTCEYIWNSCNHVIARKPIALRSFFFFPFCYFSLQTEMQRNALHLPWMPGTFGWWALVHPHQGAPRNCVKPANTIRVSCSKL